MSEHLQLVSSQERRGKRCWSSAPKMGLCTDVFCLPCSRNLQGYPLNSLPSALSGFYTSLWGKLLDLKPAEVGSFLYLAICGLMSCMAVVQPGRAINEKSSIGLCPDPLVLPSALYVHPLEPSVSAPFFPFFRSEAIDSAHCSEKCSLALLRKRVSSHVSSPSHLSTPMPSRFQACGVQKSPWPCCLFRGSNQGGLCARQEPQPLFSLSGFYCLDSAGFVGHWQ